MMGDEGQHGHPPGSGLRGLPQPGHLRLRRPGTGEEHPYLHSPDTFQPDPDVELIAKNLEGVKNIVLVLSGKVGWGTGRLWPPKWCREVWC